MRLLSLLVCVFFAISSGMSYWQQDVHYKIDAKLRVSDHHIVGKEELTYRNNSPDILDVAYFRLYWNLFTPGSYGQQYAERNKYYRFDTTGGIWLTKFTIVDGELEQTPDYHIDNTLMKVRLMKPLHTGDSVVFRCEFDERVPEDGDRTGHQSRDYNIAQWYPQISTYDKYGWDKNQYLGPAEFHLEYGTFEVNVTVPKSFILGYSGVLLNPEEVYSDSIRQRLAESNGKDETVGIADFSKEEWGDKDTADVTWKFRAEHVRDFAWSADEHYIWDVAHWRFSQSDSSIAIHALYFSDKKEFWKDVAHFGRHAISFYSAHYGMYAYPSMFVVEGVVGGGMEYPGIVFLGHLGDKNGHWLYGVVAHEIGHNWYPMMIGSNETYFAFMDEGFTTFITSTAYEDYYGRYNNSYEWTEWYQRLFHFPNDDERASIQRQALYLAKTGYEEPIATHSYRFDEPGLSGISIYPKTASVLYMLQYVLGDSTFETVMKEYYNRWKFKLPYPEDFYSTVQEVSGRRDMRWFFDEWFHRTYTCDYSVGGIKYYTVQDSNRTAYRTKISVHRCGQAIMPVDVCVEMADRSLTTVWFPYDRWINAEVECDTFVDLPSRPVKAEVNPDGGILDINRLNNRTGLPKVDLRLDNTLFDVTPIDAYLVKLRPSVWYTDEGGWNLGYKVSGSYLDDMYSSSLYNLYNFRDNSMDFDLSLYHNTFQLTPLSSVSARWFRLEGRRGASVGFRKGLRQHYSYPPYHEMYFKYSYTEADNPQYILNPSTWQQGILQRMLAGYEYTNRGRFWSVNASASFEAAIPLIGRNDFSYSKRTFEVRSDFDMPADWTLALRAYSGTGQGDIPGQTKYYFSGASPIDEFNAPFFRSKGAFPSTVRDHALYPGGGYMRGYYASSFAGDKIEAVNAEARFSSLVPFWDFDVPVIGSYLQMLQSSLFFDIGRITANPQNLWDQQFEVDWGVGIRLASLSSLLGPVANSSLLSSLELQTLRVDFPLYLSLPSADENKLKFRWVVSLNKSF